MLAALLLAILGVAVPASAQLASVKGDLRDEQGQKIEKGVLKLKSEESGREYKDNIKKGDAFIIGIVPGRYTVIIEREGQPPFSKKGFTVRLGVPDGVNPLDINLQQERASAQQGAAAQLTPEQQKQMEAQQKEAQKIKGLQGQLDAAKAAIEANQPDQAVEILTQAVAVDPTKPQLWAVLGSAYSLKKQYAESVDAYQKAIALKQDGGYYNNMGVSLARMGKIEEAVQAFNQAATLDPINAGRYYFNAGAEMTNKQQVDEANAMFDKAIQADPNFSEAYYQKGVNLLGKAKMEGNKIVAPEGTQEAFEKYLELEPEGRFAQSAKDMLASMGSEVKSTYGKGPRKKK
jgi:tetratricopeptide (TPR) repeat protein